MRLTDLGYLGYDYPDEWPIERPRVLLAGSHTNRFQLDTVDGVAEWAAMIPGDGLVYLGEHKRPFTISMFHQLRCLDIIRADLVRERSGDADLPSALTRHCLNYMRQIVLCRGDTYLESFQYPNNKDPIDKEALYECRDWEAVYDEVKRKGIVV
ncbi:hypothetical protein EIP86_004051 [Pleurotus ostreatoroseus]|nr:hypothetical protein EIP86_004051 [Pleurotus ostreatoroseus]